MEAINYFKFDLRQIKESIKYYLLISIIFISFMFFGKTYNMGSSYLFFLLIIVSSIPFSIQGNEKSNEMYYIFPGKISNMVLGRFLYLISAIFTVCLINGVIAAYLYRIHEITNIEIAVVILMGIFSLITCCIQYPLYYKFGLEKGKSIAMIIYFAPALVIFALSLSLEKSNLFIYLTQIQRYLDFVINYRFISISFIGLIMVFIGYLSYLISCRICEKKDV